MSSLKVGIHGFKHQQLFLAVIVFAHNAQVYCSSDYTSVSESVWNAQAYCRSDYTKANLSAWNAQAYRVVTIQAWMSLLETHNRKAMLPLTTAYYRNVLTIQMFLHLVLNSAISGGQAIIAILVFNVSAQSL